MPNYRNFQLASSLLRGKWAIDPLVAINSLDFVNEIISGRREIEPIEEESFKHDIGGEYPSAISHHYWNDAPSGSVAYIPIQGTLMKNDQLCGPVGMATVANMIKDANSNENIGSIFLHIDSPGGTVDGTEQLGNVIKNTSKPVITYVDGLMASAALWIGSGADEKYASTEHDEIGSVGVLLSFLDLIPYYEKEGAKYHSIVSNLSPDKTKMFEEIRNGNYENYKKLKLDPIAEKFQSVIKENLPNVSDEHLTGKVYFAKDVKGIMIDDVMPIDDAFRRAGELARDYIEEQQNNQTTNNNQNEGTMPTFKRIGQIIGNETFESTDEGIHMTEESLQAIEDHLEGEESTQSELEQAQNTVAERDNTIQERDNRITELEEQVQNLQGASAPPKEVNKEGDQGKKETGEENIWDTYSSAKETYDALGDIE